MAERLLADRDSSLMGRACELETAYVLERAPELVHLELAAQIAEAVE